jgi:drug/metabolite transporter (DMT)-like permease
MHHQWAWFAVAGVIGSIGHYCVNRALGAADATASQPVKFLDLLWMSALGFIVFGDRPTVSTLIGGVIICGATTWVARREATRRRAALA